MSTKLWHLMRTFALPVYVVTQVFPPPLEPPVKAGQIEEELESDGAMRPELGFIPPPFPRSVIVTDMASYTAGRLPLPFVGKGSERLQMLWIGHSQMLCPVVLTPPVKRAATQRLPLPETFGKRTRMRNTDRRKENVFGRIPLLLHDAPRR